MHQRLVREGHALPAIVGNRGRAASLKIIIIIVKLLKISQKRKENCINKQQKKHEITIKPSHIEIDTQQNSSLQTKSNKKAQKMTGARLKKKIKSFRKWNGNKGGNVKQIIKKKY